MKNLEKILVGISVLAIALNLSDITGGVILTVLFLAILSTFYCYLSFALFNEIGFKGIFKKGNYSGIDAGRIILAVIMGFGISAIVIGILFQVQFWIGGVFMIYMGIFFSGLSGILSYIMFRKKSPMFNRNMLYRLLFYSFLGIVSVLSIQIPGEL